MAQPTVTARPATWAGTSAPILYKLTSTNYSLSGYRLVVEVWNSLTAAKIADGKFYANSAGAVVVNVSEFLKGNMSTDNNSNLTSGSIYTDSNIFRKYYIKYQEVWTASSEVQVNDVANLRFAIYGGLQIGVANDFTDYVPANVTKKFLMLSASPKSIAGHNFLFGVIGIANSMAIFEKYSDGVLSVVVSLVIPIETVNLIRLYSGPVYNRVDVTVFTSGAFTNGRAAGGVFPFDTVTANFATSAAVAHNNFNAYHKAISGTSGVEVKIYVYVNSSNLTGLVSIFLILDDVAKTSSASNISVPVTYNGLYVLKITTSAFTPAFVEVLLDNQTGGNVNWDVTSVDDIASETKTITIDEDCPNIIMLAWRNSLGGHECFPFVINQEYSWYYGDRKAKRLTLFANNLTLSQWESIQGLNTLGELYRTPITEFTTSINRTSSTVGQSVYVLNADGTKTGVNVIGQPNTTNTKQKTHQAVVTIEYPELYLQ